AIVAIDGSKFKAVNNRDKNFTDNKLAARMQQLEESIARYLGDLDRAGRGPDAAPEADGRTDASGPRWAGLVDRSGCPLDGDQRPSYRCRGLQRADGGGCQEPPDCRARGHQQRLRSLTAFFDGQANSRGDGG